MKNEEKALAFLKSFTVNDGEKDRHVPVIERGDGIIVSAEDEQSYLFADYYGEYHGGLPYVNPDLEAGLAKLGMFLEWENPGALRVCEV